MKAKDFRTELIRLELIRLDGGTQSRVEEVSEEVTDWYAQLIGDGVALPAISVVDDGESIWLVDGFKRYGAEASLGHTEIKCIVQSGTLEDAQWLSYAANKTHGQPRTKADKRHAIEQALRHPKSAEMTAREIAKHCGVHFTTVAQYRAQVDGLVDNLQSSTPGQDASLVASSESSGRVGRENEAERKQEPASHTSNQEVDSVPVVINPSPQEAATALVAENFDAQTPVTPTSVTVDLSVSKKSPTLDKPVAVLKRDAHDGLGKCIRRVDDLRRATGNHSRHGRCLVLVRQLWDEIEGFQEGVDGTEDDGF